MKPHPVRSTFPPKIRTSCPVVNGPELLMANMISLANNTQVNAGCGQTAHRHRRILALSMNIESGVSSARDPTEPAEAFVEMILPQLLNTTVTKDHTMRFPTKSRISRSPRGWTVRSVVQGWGVCQYALVTSKNSTSQPKGRAV